MKLTKLIIQNFKGLGKNFQLVIPNTLNFEFIAKNKFGKSSITDAIFWVLTGKMLSGSSDIMSIKPKDNSSALVSVELQFEDGTSIMKTYQENWVKTRGTTDKTLQGHSTNCFINGINIPVTKFDESLLEHFKVSFKGAWKGNLLQLLIDPLYFGVKETWQERRKLVIDLVGDVTDQDVFEQNEKLKVLQNYLLQSKGKLEDIKTIINKNLKDLSEEEKKLLAQVEVLTAEQTITIQQFNEASVKLKTIESTIQNLNNKKYQGQKEIIAERKEEIANLVTMLSDYKQKDNETYQKSIENQQTRLQELRIEKSNIQTEFNDLNNRINELNHKKSNNFFEQKRKLTQIDSNEKTMEKLREKWARIKSSEFETSDSLICPQCVYDLNGELVDDKRKKFNLTKAKELEEIQLDGKQLVVINESIQLEIKDLQIEETSLINKITELTPKTVDYNNKLTSLNQSENELINSIPQFELSKDTLDLQNSIQTLELKPYPVVPDEQKIISEINQNQSEKYKVQEIVNKYNSEQMNITKAKQLQAKLDGVMISIADFESLQDLLKSFIETKLNILNERVASVFGNIKFQLVESNLKEGSWNEVCYVLDGDVPYHNTNSASKITIGIAVCEAIKRKLSLQGLFYLIDNAEQITDRDFSKLSVDQTLSFVAMDVEPSVSAEVPGQIDLFGLGEN